MPTQHTPVLLDEVLRFLNPQPGQNFIDCTLGGGGHARAILAKIGPNGKLLAIDADPKAIKNFQSTIEQSNNQTIVINDNFQNLKEIYTNNFNNIPVHGILIDLGWSSDQLLDSGKGLTFQDNQPLDMRFGQSELTAAEIINTYTQEELFNIFTQFGEERPDFARRLCKEIKVLRKNKPFKTTQDLVDLIVKIIPRQGKLHPATKVFQALRIEVNQELEVLKAVLPQAIDLLAPGGRLAIIAFHGLEDKIVKDFFRLKSRQEDPEIFLLTKKPVQAKWAEIQSNRRARSAKLRVAEKIV